tara:strand:+ start:1409 stop:2110 length:702 start_codon:yes stop_codon:yes gene_type:complete
MSDPDKHLEHHFIHRIGWLRAAVLGANDGIISIASLIMGVAAASSGHDGILIAGIAGLVAGAMSMAAGEYVSVSSQSDTERADLATEQRALDSSPEVEHEELAQIYVARGVTTDLARQVASQLTAHDPLGAHARDELGMSHSLSARPIQAAVTSALAFSVGAGLPLLVAVIAPVAYVSPAVAIMSLIALAVLGVVSARLGGARAFRAAARLTILGAVAMALTSAIGTLFGTVV